MFILPMDTKMKFLLSWEKAALKSDPTMQCQEGPYLPSNRRWAGCNTHGNERGWGEGYNQNHVVRHMFGAGLHTNTQAGAQ